MGNVLTLLRCSKRPLACAAHVGKMLVDRLLGAQDGSFMCLGSLFLCLHVGLAVHSCRLGKGACLTTSAAGIWTAKVAKWRCIRGVMLKDPAVGFMQAQYCTLVTSLSTTLACNASHTTCQLLNYQI